MKEEYHYRIYQPDNMNGKLTVVKVSWGNKYDNHYVTHNKNRFFTDSNNEPLKFTTKDDAIRWLNSYVKIEWIAPEYIRVGYSKIQYLKD